MLCDNCTRHFIASEKDEIKEYFCPHDTDSQNSLSSALLNFDVCCPYEDDVSVVELHELIIRMRSEGNNVTLIKNTINESTEWTYDKVMEEYGEEDEPF